MKILQAQIGRNRQCGNGKSLRDGAVLDDKEYDLELKAGVLRFNKKNDPWPTDECIPVTNLRGWTEAPEPEKPAPVKK